MKIVYLYSSLAITGGVERVLIDKMNYLVGQFGYDVYMITSDQGDHPIVYPMDDHIHHQDLGIRFHTQYRHKGWKRFKESRRLSKLYQKRLKQALDEIKPNIIVCTTSHNVRNLLRIKGEIPLVVESHVNYSHPGSLLLQLRTWRNNYWIGKAEAVVTLTHGDAHEWEKVSRHIHVIPNIAHQNEVAEYSDCTGKKVIFAGRLVEQKGLPELIKIWKIVNGRFPDWRLDIFGNGQMESIPSMQLYVHEPTAEIFQEYLHSSMLLLTSVYEPFGLVLPEAMSCGLPVVAFDCPYGPADIIEDGVNGYLIKNRDMEQFALRVCQLIESVELRQQMGQQGIISSQRFRADAIMPKWKELFESLVAEESLA